MPVVSIRSVGKLSKNQKEKIAETITQVLFEVANKPHSATYITFEEFERENWAKGGKLLD